MAFGDNHPQWLELGDLGDELIHFTTPHGRRRGGPRPALDWTPSLEPSCGVGRIPHTGLFPPPKGETGISYLLLWGPPAPTVRSPPAGG
jgi:hypothetical protein